MLIDTLAIVGVGLIGGSIAAGVRKRGIARHIVGVNHRPSTRDYIVSSGLVDEAFATIAEAAPHADLIVFCTPVDRLPADVLDAAPHCRPGTLLTDAGSTKAVLVRSIDGRLPSGVAFVGSHPLAGSEKQGPKHADADLFVGRLVVVTPTERTDDKALSRTCEFWQALGARVKGMLPEEHDRALALTSHLPHLVASALAGLLPPELAELTATGFRDTTRVAAGDPGLWTAIFRANRAALREALDGLEARLDAFRHAIDADDASTIERLLAEGKRNRDGI